MHLSCDWIHPFVVPLGLLPTVQGPKGSGMVQWYLVWPAPRKRFFGHLSQVQQSIKGIYLKQSQWQECEAIDQIVTFDKLSAYCQYRKINMSNEQWCPQLTRVIQRVLYGKACWHKRRCGTLAHPSFARGLRRWCCFMAQVLANQEIGIAR